MVASANGRPNNRLATAAEDALETAQRNVLAAAAFDLSAIERFGIELSLFSSPAGKAAFTLLSVFHRQYPDARQAPYSRLALFAASVPELAGLFSDETLTVEELAPMLDSGGYAIDFLAGNVETLKAAAWESRRREILAGLDKLSPNRFADEAERLLIELRKDSSSDFELIDAADLIEQNPDLDPPVIGGIFRIGEVCNVIAKSKIGKSWLVYGMVLSIAFGLLWLGRFTCMAGKVLLIDNELKKNTLASRLAAVARALGIDPKELRGRVDVICLRGKLKDIEQLRGVLNDSIRDKYVAVFLDAGYKFLPAGWKENDNGDMSRFYNLLDHYAETTKAAIVSVVHATKGSQSDKDVTDVGSGAGAISRSADTHLIFRPHEEAGSVVMEAALRSFAPLEPLAIRYTHPLWHPAEDLDPSALKGTKTAKANEVAAAKLDSKRQKVVEYLGSAEVRATGASKTAIKDHTGINHGLGMVLDSLVKDGNLRKTCIIVPENGRTFDAWAIATDVSDGTAGLPDNCRTTTGHPVAQDNQAGGNTRTLRGCVSVTTLPLGSAELPDGFSPEDDSANQSPKTGKRTRKPSKARKASA